MKCLFLFVPTLILVVLGGQVIGKTRLQSTPFPEMRQKQPNKHTCPYDFK